MAEIKGPQAPLIPRPLNTEGLKVKPPVIDHSSEKYKTFSETLKSFTNDVNELQMDAGKTIERFLTGEIKDAHDVMIAVEKAGVSFEMMMEIRNKMIETYHEMFRMQV